MASYQHIMRTGTGLTWEAADNVTWAEMNITWNDLKETVYTHALKMRQVLAGSSLTFNDKMGNRTVGDFTVDELDESIAYTHLIKTGTGLTWGAADNVLWSEMDITWDDLQKIVYTHLTK